MKNVCAIYDSDEQYGKRLMSVISHRKNVSFGIQLFTKEKEIAAYLDKYTPDILVIGETCCTGELAKKYHGSVLVLTEEEGKLSQAAKDSFQEKIGIYKYQPADAILREIVHYTGKEGEENYSNEMIGVYSPIQEPLRTNFALSLAKILSETERTLYVNLEEFSGLDEVLASSGGETFSDAMYYYRQTGGQITGQIKSVISTSAGVDYIPPVQYAQDISLIDTEQTAAFILDLAKTCGYEKVVLEISSAVKEQWKLLLKCNKVYMPVKEDYLSQRKVMGFEKYLLLSGMEHMWNHIEKLSLPQKVGRIQKTYLSGEEGEEMNGFVRKILAG